MENLSKSDAPVAWQIRALEEIIEELKKKYPWLASQDFPVLEMSLENDEMKKYLGFAIMDHKEGRFLCERIEMKCKYVSKEGEQIELELIRLIPTFLHEIAHVLRESKRKLSEFESNKRKIKRIPKKDLFAHDDQFYQDLKDIYKDAEALQRFDDVDGFECSLDMCGSSVRFPESIKHRFISHGKSSESISEGIVASPELTQNSNPLRAEVFNLANGQRKGVFLKERSLEALLLQSSQKLQLKKSKNKLSAYTSKGIRITDENIGSLNNDELIRISVES